MNGPDVPGGAGASAGGFPWMAVGIAALILLAVVAVVAMMIARGRRSGPRPTRERTRQPWRSPALVGLVSVAALAASAGAIYLVVDLIRSGGLTGGGDVVEGYYTRQDLVDPSMGSAWYFDTASGTATYYAFWEPGTCDFSDPGSGPYSVVGGELILAGVWQASLSGDGRSFEIDAPGQWSGDDSEGISGLNMTVMNGISGTYVASSECS